MVALLKPPSFAQSLADLTRSVTQEDVDAVHSTPRTSREGIYIRRLQRIVSRPGEKVRKTMRKSLIGPTDPRAASRFCKSKI